MRTFLYKAKNSKGQIITGTVKANDNVQAERILISHNFVVLDLSANNKSKALFSFSKKISAKERALFSRQLATMISSGLELSRALKLMSAQSRNETARDIYLELYKDIEEGNSFSGALAKHSRAFNQVFVSVVNAGENTGKLDVVLTELADQLENDNNFSGKVRGAMYYPGFILAALIGIGGYMMVNVIPQLKGIFDSMGGQLPWATKVLLGLSGFFVSFWWIVLLVIIGASIFLKYWFGSLAGKHFKDKLALTVPGFKGLFEGIYMYRFSKVMSMLIGAGVPLLDSLRIGGNTLQNDIYTESINKTIEQVEKGIPLSVQLSKDPIFPPLFGQMTAVGEETGKLDLIFEKIADYYEESTNQAVNAISTLIEPVILVIMGLGVAFLVFAVLVPIYNVAQLQ